jgi:hypothetical protein
MKNIISLVLFLSSFSGFSQTGAPYVWPAYSPNISYNFKDEFSSLAQPNNILNDCYLRKLIVE